MEFEKLILAELQKVNTQIGEVKDHIVRIDGRLDSQEARMDAMQEEITQMHGEITQLQTGMTQLQEYAEVTRAGVNRLIDWADQVGAAIDFPLPKL